MNGYNFTDRSRKVLQLAREESARLQHEYVGTEHILLGLIREGEGVAAAVLTNLNVDQDEIRGTIEETVKQGKGVASDGADLPYTSRAVKVLELAMSEARDLDHSYVGTEHLLLGLLREEKGMAAQVLIDAGVTLEMARHETLRLLGRDDARSGAPQVHGSSPVSRGRGTGGYNFTDKIREGLQVAREEAIRLHNEYVETGHLLLAILQGTEATKVFELLRVDVDALEERVRKGMGMGKRGQGALDHFDVPYTSRAKKVLEYAMAEARGLDHSFVGGEHVLLGLIREGEGDVAEAIRASGVTLEATRAAVLQIHPGEGTS
ncbi:MAG TPA: Clp protease N-terminal domain-containing protein [Gemmatimonadales bacterium]|jgi:ATP-dependent Clp protease ATP-binding subunit ClpA